MDRENSYGIDCPVWKLEETKDTPAQLACPKPTEKDRFFSVLVDQSIVLTQEDNAVAQERAGCPFNANYFYIDLFDLYRRQSHTNPECSRKTSFGVIYQVELQEGTKLESNDVQKETDIGIWGCCLSNSEE